MTTITALPTPPSRDDPANFASRGDAFLAALPDFVTETNTVAGEVNTNAGTASTAASTATTQAGIATTQAGIATTKANEASGSADAAAASALSAANLYDSFDDRYLGAKASDPTVDNDGNTLLTGALYYNSTAGQMRAYSGATWEAAYLPASDYAQLDLAQSWTAQQTFLETKDTVYTLATSGTIALDPANGNIQSTTLTGDPTFTDSLEAGQTIVLRIVNGASYTVTWATTTWVTSAGNTAPTLTADDTVVFWKIGSTLFGAYVGSGE